jgi:hypothetical protein
LFPGTVALDEKENWVTAYYLEQQQMYRITLTAPFLNRARKLLVIAFGETKAEALKEVIEGPYNPRIYPAQLLAPSQGEIIIFGRQKGSKIFGRQYLIKKINMITHHLKDIQHNSERAITPFHIFELDRNALEEYREPHTKDHFCLLFVKKGKMKMQVEDRRYDVTENNICVIFPGQLSSKEQISSNFEAR